MKKQVKQPPKKKSKLVAKNEKQPAKKTGRPSSRKLGAKMKQAIAEFREKQILRGDYIPWRGGRPTNYSSDYHPEHAYKFCLLGSTNEQLAKNFDLTVEALQSWRTRYPEFEDAIQQGRIFADSNIALSLYKRALGYEVEDVYFSSYQGEVTQTPYIKKVPPDVTAIMYWLSNRLRFDWLAKSTLEKEVNSKEPPEEEKTVVYLPKNGLIKEKKENE